MTSFVYNLTLDFIASQVHLSREHLSRAFKKYTGMSTNKYRKANKVITDRS